MICVSISNSDQIAPAIESGAELIELRLDLLGREPADLYPGMPQGLGTVVTCRPGTYGEGERSRLLTESVQLGATYVDLELETSESHTEPIIKVAAEHGCNVIFSHHDFEATPGPDQLRTILAQCYSRGGTVAKIATQVLSRQDLLNLISLYDLPGRKVILGMGTMGRVTRIVAPYLGAEFTFASPETGNETAPGQLSTAQLEAIYKVINTS